MLLHRLLFPLIMISLLISTTGIHPDAAAATWRAEPLLQAEALSAEVDPSIDLDNFHPRSAFSVRFNQPMDTTSAEEPVLTYPYLAGEHSWKEGGTVLEFAPPRGFEPGTAYEIYLGRTLRALSGQVFAIQPHWTVSTLSGPQAIQKTDSLMAWGKQPSTQLVFDQPMDRASVAAALRVVPDITLDLSWDGDQLGITPAVRAEPGTRYHLTLLAGEVGARSADGIPLDASLQWSWYVPTLQASVVGVSEKGFEIAFNYHLDRNRSAPAYRIEPDVAGTWKWSSNSGRRFVAMQRFKPAVRYTLFFEGAIYSEYGELIPNPELVEFTIPPPIRSVQPKEVDWRTNTNEVSIHFSRGMDKSSIEDAFLIDPPTPGKFTWVGNVMLYRFDSPLEKGPSLRFTVTLGTAASDEAGEPILLEPYSWSYETVDWSYDREAGLFGFGALDQVVDVNGRRAIHVGVKPGWVTYKLYRLELGDFVQRHKPSLDEDSRWEGIDAMEPAYTWPVQYQEGTVDEVILPGDVMPGLYILTGRGPENALDHLFVTLTRNSLLVKESPDELMVWMTDINGGPVGGREVRLYATTGEHVQGCVTKEDGICRIMIPPGYRPMILAGRGEGNDVAISGMSGNWYKWDDGGWSNWYSEYHRGSRHLVYTYTERPIYRPGQEVNFKSILRYDRDVQYSLLPAKTPVRVILKDGRDNIVQSLDLESSTFSAVNGSFRLSEGAMLGQYVLETIVEGASYTQTFEVQEYRKPDIQVIVKTDADRYVVGDPIKVDVEVRTYSGTPVANAVLKITGSRVDRRERTDHKGRFTMTITAREPSYYSRGEYGSSLRYNREWLQVSADDGSFQEAVGSTQFWLYSANAWVRFERLPKLIVPGQPFEVQMIAQTLGGEPAPGTRLELQLRQYNYQRWEYQVQGRFTTETDEHGKAALSLQVPKPGHYNLHLQLKDEWNRILGETDGYIFVHSAGSDYDIRSDQKIEIEAERDRYKPYETAQLVIQSTFSGPALLTFERGRVIHTQPVDLTAPITVVSTPVLPEYAPNIFVTLNAYDVNNTRITEANKQSRWYISSKPDSLISIKSVELRVDATEKALQIEIQSDSDHYRPRQEATFNISVRDQQGQPVDTELSVAVVDESIFSIFTDTTPAIFDAFYGIRAKTVSSYSSFRPSRYWIEGARGGGGDDETFTPRDDFPDTAIWIPVVRTGSDGAASVTVKLPDSLTSWRVTVKAATAGSRVGEAFINVETRQDVVIRPVLPASVMSGDTVQLSAMVYNNTTGEREVNVSVTGRLLEFENMQQTITVAPGTSRMISWHARASRSGDDSLLFYLDAGDGYQDAVRLNLPVKPVAVLDVTNQTGVLLDERKFTFLVPEDVLASSTIEIELSRSIAGTLLEGLEFLTGYPYGCVEQTLSKALPNAAVSRVYDQLGISESTINDRLPQYIADGVVRLAGMQQYNGAWGWWFDDSSSVYLTSLVVFGLALTADAGYAVDAAIIDRGAQFLIKQYEGINLESQAFALYALSTAGQGEPDQALALLKQAADLDAFSLAALALVLDMEGYPEQASSLLTLLSDSAERNGDQVYWTDRPERAADNSRIMASPVRSTALALTAYLRLQKHHADIPLMVRYLINMRGGKGWSNTNDTTFAILALTDYVVQTLRDEGEVSYRLELDGREVVAGLFEGGKPSVIVTLPASELSPGLSLLKIEQQGADQVYYRVTGLLEREAPEIEADGVIKVSRFYRDPKTKKNLTTFVQGQLVEVNLTVTFPASTYYVILEDYLPGGFEALNERLNSATNYGTRYGGYWYPDAPSYWSQYGYNQKEVRPDRVTFFITEPGSGVLTFTYMARVTHAGEYTALPAEVQAMYKPEIWGRGKSDKIIVGSP